MLWKYVSKIFKKALVIKEVHSEGRNLMFSESLSQTQIIPGARLLLFQFWASDRYGRYIMSIKLEMVNG